MKILDKLFKYEENKEICGLTKELNALYIYNYYKNNDKNVVVLTNTLYEANNIYKSLKTYDDECLLFPMDDFITSMAIAISPDFKIKRLEVEEKLLKEKNNKHLIVTSLMGYLKYLPNIDEEKSIIIKKDDKIISREIILQKLSEYGYKRESLVTTTGEYAVRGYIIDIFPVDNDKPIRIEFFDETVEKIKSFDENTQMTIKDINSIELKRIEEQMSTKNNSLLDYATNNAVFMIDETQIKASYQKLLMDILDYKENKNVDKTVKYMYEFDEIKRDTTYYINNINMIKDKNTIIYNSVELENFNSNMDKLYTYCKKEEKNNTIIFALENDKQIRIIKNLFDDALVTSIDKIEEKHINIIKKPINKGFKINNYIFISPYDIDNIKRKDIKYKNTIKIGRKIKTYSDLTMGDFVVHETYGIGIYNGLKTLKTRGKEKDYVEVLYAGNDKVYVPVENIDKLYKYTDKLGSVPKLDKLNSTSWAKKKLETRKKIRDISGELLELYTNRNQVLCAPYKDFEEEISFALTFPYTLTDDQEKAINEINEDLKKNTPMDRLLCGDVGYGKTEVAFRAMFKTVLNGFQVAYLCPTTLLSRQQYLSAEERFKEFGINVELLNRHTSTKKVKEILDKLEKGTTDIVIGTHKLLNDKIKYKNLGLLVIDEEQRFGVTHKEKIKELKTDVNVLTLSATPIPRTLKMALSGLRSLSVLDTPPVNRYPIQTYVIEENDLIIRDAIYKELSRNGQIYILVNSIEEIPKYTKKLKELVSEANIVYAHGQMSSEEINDIMEDFIDKKYDILVCTTIIETGIDIGNVNTIIILNSDNFGLSQLYQIRGRVGRSDKIAYAYLMYNPAKVLTETAGKRLNSIKEFTELGSGYKIAMRDLSIRGAGDLLGREQAGFIDAVGLDLYTRMVNEEISRLQGKSVEDDKEETTTTTFNIRTHIDDNYVSDENIKIEIHKLISSINTKEDYNNVKRELEDRFGKINEDIEIYMLEKLSENIIDKLGIKVIEQPRKITLIIPEEISNKQDGEKLFMMVYKINPKFMMTYKDKKISINLIIDNLKKNYIYYTYELLEFLNNTTK